MEKRYFMKIERKKKRKKRTKGKQSNNKMALNTYLSIITLNVNGLNAPTKRQKVAEWIRKEDPYIRCLQETYLRQKHTHRLHVKEQKNIFHANGKETKAGVAVLIFDKTDFKAKLQ